MLTEVGVQKRSLPVSRYFARRDLSGFGLRVLRSARQVYCASHDHLDFLSSYFRRRTDDLKLLDPDGTAIDDPYQQGMTVHRRVAEVLAAACEARARELAAPADGRPQAVD